MTSLPPPTFEPSGACWVCGTADLVPFHEALIELEQYREQDPELASYTGSTVWLRRCARCGFAQPERLPSLPRFFERMYDQRWSPAWVASEFESEAKDLIFSQVLAALGARVPRRPRRLLDVGTHAGRFLARAHQAGWTAEGIEVNPRTAAHAAACTGARIHRLGAAGLARLDSKFDALTLTDVLEHIPHPVDVLASARARLVSCGWIAVKVPCGPVQDLKERWRARLRPGYRPTLADNLVHVNQFSPRSLRLALERAGFTDVTIEIGAPERPPGRLSSAFRMAFYRTGRTLPLAAYTLLALNLQAYGRNPD